MLHRRMFAVASSLTLLLGGAASAASGSEPLAALQSEQVQSEQVQSTHVKSWEVQVHDGVRVSVRVQCSADDTAAVAVHLVDPFSRGAMYTATIDAGSSAMAAGPTSNLVEADPVYYFLNSGRSAAPRGTVTVAMTKSLGTDATKNATLTFDRPSIDCTLDSAPQIL